MKINSEIARFSLNSNLHVEWFIWCYLRTINDSGCYTFSDFKNCKILESSIKRKLKTNPFFTVSGNKIFLKSKNNLPVKFGKRTFICDVSELNKFLITDGKNSKKLWSSKLIKYLMICVVACQYNEEKPYALKLISLDTGCSISIIQRALKCLYVERWFVEQQKDTNRSFHYNKKIVNLTPNFYKFNLGFYFIKRYF